MYPDCRYLQREVLGINSLSFHHLAIGLGNLEGSSLVTVGIQLMVYRPIISKIVDVSEEQYRALY